MLNPTFKTKFYLSLLLVLLAQMLHTHPTKATTDTKVGWVTTGNMNVSRVSHAAALLSNGKVLISGGTQAIFTDTLRSTELYDPTTGNFTYTGSMGFPRSNHTATTLPNGQVLVTGGYSGTQVISTAELYDPATGTFTKTNDMYVRRAFHTATLLANGKVLIIGSDPVGFGLGELYDPATGTFTFTGSLNFSRSRHTATLLPDGKVIIIAGNLGGEYALERANLSSIEMYDPITNQFTVVGSLNEFRAGHTASLLPNNKILVVAGGRPTEEIYDISTHLSTSINIFGGGGFWSPFIHSQTATTLANGNVLIAGGFIDLSVFGGASSNDSHVYSLLTSKATYAGEMPDGRRDHTTTLLANGKVLVTGGFGFTVTGTIRLSSADLYTPVPNTYLTLIFR